jgi:hypothetical protein
VIEAKLARAPGSPEPAKSPSTVVLAVWGPMTAELSAVSEAAVVWSGASAGARVGALVASLVGVAERREGPVVLVGHKWVVVLVVLEVLGGTVIVVGGAGIVAGTGPGRAAAWSCGADGSDPFELARCAGGDGATSMESKTTTAVAVTSGVATTLVAG